MQESKQEHSGNANQNEYAGTHSLPSSEPLRKQTKAEGVKLQAAAARQQIKVTDYQLVFRNL